MKPALISHHTYNKKVKEILVLTFELPLQNYNILSYTHPTRVELSLFIPGVEKWKRRVDCR